MENFNIGDKIYFCETSVDGCNIETYFSEIKEKKENILYFDTKHYWNVDIFTEYAIEHKGLNGVFVWGRDPYRCWAIMKEYIYKTQTEYAQQHLRAAQKALAIPFPNTIEEK